MVNVRWPKCLSYTYSKMPICAKWHLGKRPWFISESNCSHKIPTQKKKMSNFKPPFGLNEKQLFDIFHTHFLTYPSMHHIHFLKLPKVDLSAKSLIEFRWP